MQRQSGPAPITEGEYLFGNTSSMRSETARYPSQSALVFNTVAGHLKQGQGGISEAVRYFDEVSRLQREVSANEPPVTALELTRADLWLQLGRRKRALAALELARGIDVGGEISNQIPRAEPVAEVPVRAPASDSQAAVEYPLSLEDEVLRAHLLLETGQLHGAYQAYRALQHLGEHSQGGSQKQSSVPLEGLLLDEVRAFERVAVFQNNKQQPTNPLPNEPCSLEAGVIELLVCGRIAEESGELQQALSYTQRAAKGAPELRSIALDELRIMLKLGRTAEVMQRLLGAAEKASGARDLQRFISTTSAQQSANLKREITRNAPGGLSSTGDLRAKIAARDLRAGRAAAALRQISLVLAAEPKNDSARLLRASLLSAAGRRVEARADLLAIEPGQASYSQARLLAAQLGRLSGQLRQASDDLKPVASRRPTDRLAALTYVSLLREQGRLEEALSFVESLAAKEQVESLAPSSPTLTREISWPWIERVHLLKELERDDEALALAEQLLKRDGNEPQILNFIAYELAQRYATRRTLSVDLSRAEALARRAVTGAPDEPFYRDTLGWVLMQRGEYTEAVSELRKAHEKLPDDLAIGEHLGDALEALSRGSGYEVYLRMLEKAQDRERAGPDVDRLSSDERAIRDRLEVKIRQQRQGLEKEQEKRR